MGHALHDTIRSQNVAENFECLPEQLLERVRHLQPATGVTERYGDVSTAIGGQY